MCVYDTGKFGENGAQLCVVVILGQLGKVDQNNWKVLNYGAGEEWGCSVGPIVSGMAKITEG